MNQNPAISPDEAFGRLGLITRQLHEAMTHLGIDVHLHRIAHEIPDARDRLSYVGQMTEQAAHKVLGLVEQAKPECAHLHEHALGQQREIRKALESSGADVALRQTLAQVEDFTRAAAQHAENQERTLSDIMMSQDFQDLSGQVIKKVIDIISRTETQLLQLLKDTAPEHVAAAVAASQNEGLQGPLAPDKAMKQDDVDDLLAQMGF
ncbi:MAG: protein phosphatase CheZ [Rubrivivax sp.]